MTSRLPIHVAVCGPGTASPEHEEAAETIGRGLAEAGAVVVCGGVSGVMDAAARGARAGGGLAIGILPGRNRSDASEHLSAAVVSGMGEARNALVVRSADVVIAVDGEYGTLSEIALALKMGIPVVGLGTWRLSKDDGFTDPIVRVETTDEAVAEALRLAGGG